MEYLIKQYSALETGALEIQYIEEYFGEFPRKKTATEIVSRLRDREFLILMAEAPLRDDPGTIVPVAFKIVHEIRANETEPKLVDLVARLHEQREVRGSQGALQLGGRHAPRLARPGPLPGADRGIRSVGARGRVSRSRGQDQESLLRHARHARPARVQRDQIRDPPVGQSRVEGVSEQAADVRRPSLAHQQPPRRRRRLAARSAGSEIRKTSRGAALLRLQAIHQPAQRSRDRHAGAVDRAHVEPLRDLSEIPLRLDARDDHLAIARAQLHEHGAIALVGLGSNGFLERRRHVRRQIFGQFRRRGMPADSAHLVADPVDDRLPEVRLHGADVPRLEGIESPQHVQHGFLDQVAGIQAPPRRRRQAPVRKSPEAWNRPLQQRLDRHAVAFPRSDDQFNGRLVAEQRGFIGRTVWRVRCLLGRVAHVV